MQKRNHPDYAFFTLYKIDMRELEVSPLCHRVYIRLLKEQLKVAITPLSAENLR
jgi:hypothetical protein